MLSPSLPKTRGAGIPAISPLLTLDLVRIIWAAPGSSTSRARCDAADHRLRLDGQIAINPENRESALPCGVSSIALMGWLGSRQRTTDYAEQSCSPTAAAGAQQRISIRQESIGAILIEVHSRRASNHTQAYATYDFIFETGHLASLIFLLTRISTS